MKNIPLILISILFVPLLIAKSAMANPQHSTNSVDLPKQYGIGIDYCQLDQNYSIDQLQLFLPTATLTPNNLVVSNKTDYLGLKLDSWLLPYLNVFAVIGEVSGTTRIDLNSFNLPETAINYSGELYGAGITLAAGYRNLFTSLSLSYSDTSIDGSFQSSVSSITIQPKIGFRLDDWDLWLGSSYLSTNESHNGTIALDPNSSPSIPFDVELSNQNKTNYGVGVRIKTFPPFNFIIDAGFGNRNHILGNAVYRF